MKLGERLRQARLEAGLSQRQLAGDRITRNMLSQIENGSAAPSMETLRFLAGRLGKPMSFFLDERETDAALLERAWAAYESGEAAEALSLVEQHAQGREAWSREGRPMPGTCWSVWRHWRALSSSFRSCGSAG